MTKIYVGNLPFSADEAAVRQLFEQHGKVDSVALINDRETDRKSTRLNSSHIPLSRMPSSA